MDEKIEDAHLEIFISPKGNKYFVDTKEVDFLDIYNRKFKKVSSYPSPEEIVKEFHEEVFGEKL